METSTSQLTSEQPAAATTKTPLEPDKKDIPSPKTKKKLQWDSRRGTIMIKSNPITPRWVIHKLEKNYIAEAFQKEWKFWALHQASQAECLAMERGALRESGFEGQWDLITRLRKRETPLLKVTHKVSYTSGTRGESSGFISAWAWVRPTCWYRRFSCKVGGGGGGRHSCGSLWGQRHWLQEFWGILSGMSTPGSHRFLTKIRLVPTAYKLQCWDASGQTSNQGRSIADRLLKVLVSSQLPTKHSPWHSPAYQRDKTQLHSPAGRNQSFPPASLYNSCIHHGADSRNKNYNPAT